MVAHTFSRSLALRRAVNALVALALALPLIGLSAFSAAPAAAADCRAYHTVQRGETLYRIGLKYNLTWDRIARANNLANADKIYAGQVLCIPASASATPTKTPTSGPTPTATPTATAAPERIAFARGAVSGSVQGTVTAPARKTYVLRALKGQQMTVEVISPDNKANFAAQGVSDGQPLKRLENESRKWTGTLPANQDYLITVAVASGTSNYTLVVTIVTP